MKTWKSKCILGLVSCFLISCSSEAIDKICDIQPEEISSCALIDLFDIKSGISLNTLFTDTQTIEIPPYSYPTPPDLIPIFGSLIDISGDDNLAPFLAVKTCCDISDVIDIYPTKPSFQWNSIPNSLVAASIFKTKIIIELNGNRIENVNDIVWTWNSGMDTGIQSGGKTSIEYQDGKDVSSGKILNTTTPLASNEAYVWAVWAWNESGTNIELSSRAIPFVTESIPPLPFNSLIQLNSGNSRWTIQSAVDSNTGTDITSTFPIQAFFAGTNCNTGTTYRLIPSDEQGKIIELNNKSIIIGNIVFFEILFTCDEEILAIANYEDNLYNVAYKLE